MEDQSATSSSPTAQHWIDSLSMQPHPEGGWFAETYASHGQVETKGGQRCAVTAIYFLVDSGHRSTLHRLASDEMWCFHTGHSIQLHILFPEDHLGDAVNKEGKALKTERVGSYKCVVLGPDVMNGEQLHYCVPAGCWFGATVDVPGEWGLVTCCMAPGWDVNDFEFGSREDLVKAFPEQTALVERLCHS